MSNHLGNVLVTISDKKLAVASTTDPNLIAYYNADVVTANDYYPFGSLQPGRNYNASGAKDYRYGFNGKENDNEVKGEGNQQDYKMRIYDPRLGRFLSIDPKAAKGPQYSPYSVNFNNPILYYDPNGEWPVPSHYQMTFRALRREGINRATAKQIAHYASVYSDHPKVGRTLENQAIGIATGFSDTKALRYNDKYETSANSGLVNSQSYTDLKMQAMHGTRAAFEKETVTPEQAVQRSLYGGTFKDDKGNDVKITGAFEVLDKYKGSDLTKLGKDELKEVGVALHTVEDVFAHKGAVWEEDPKDNEHSTSNDKWGSRKEAKAKLKEVIKEYFGQKKSD